MKPTSFLSTALSPAIIRALGSLGFRDMTPIQSATIPLLLQGKDIVGQSNTGSGKTLAFLLPALAKCKMDRAFSQILILCPTRELCDQVFRQAERFTKIFPGLSCVSLVGGQPAQPQQEALRKGSQIVLGTPGRTLEHLQNAHFRADKIEMFVLDEADRLLEEGFEQEMKAIFHFLPKNRQTVFFSATFPKQIEAFSELYQNEAIRITELEALSATPIIQQYLYFAEKPQKLETLLRVLKKHFSRCTLIFCRTKSLVDEIGKAMGLIERHSAVLHADLKQSERDRVSKLFRDGKLKILVATDVAARGLDINILDLVVNVDLPSSTDIYIHRIGRTGRAGKTGVAVAIATEYEIPLVAEIESATGVPFIREGL